MIFWDFLMVEHIFHSPLVKRGMIISSKLVYTSYLTSCRTKYQETIKISYDYCVVLGLSPETSWKIEIEPFQWCPMPHYSLSQISSNNKTLTPIGYYSRSISLYNAFLSLFLINDLKYWGISSTLQPQHNYAFAYANTHPHFHMAYASIPVFELYIILYKTISYCVQYII